MSKTPTANAPYLNGTDVRSSLLKGFESEEWYWEYAPWWICSGVIAEWWDQECTMERALALADNWIVYNWAIDHCLIGPAGDNDVMCGFHYSTTIYIVAVCCMTIESLVILYVAIAIWPNASTARASTDSESQDAHESRRTEPKKPALGGATMVTLGDTLAEYLKTRDEWTSLDPSQTSNSRRPSFSHLRVGKWVTKSPSWFSAVSALTWICTSTIIFLSVILGSVLFTVAIVTLKRKDLGYSASDIWQYGLGLNSFALVGGPVLGPEGSRALSFSGKVLFVNLFQVLISVLYLFYNNCLTKQVIAAEMSHFMDGSERKTLRVSSHVGMQRSTFMLTLPWRYSVPLVVSFVALHFFVSRGTFIVKSIAWTAGPNDQAQHIHSEDTSRVGYSSLGILISTLLGSAMYVVLLLHSFRSYEQMPSYLPRIANKTSFISAACQRPDGDKDAHHYWLKFWAVDQDACASGRAGHKMIVFSTDIESKRPSARDPDEEYLQPMPVGEWDDWMRMYQAVQAAWRSVRRAVGMTRGKIRMLWTRMYTALQTAPRLVIGPVWNIRPQWARVVHRATTKHSP